MPRILWTHCPGKINLGLRVQGRRDDGYHDLDTVFCQFQMADRLEFMPGGEFSDIEVSPELEGCCADDNLVIKAAREYGKAVGCEVNGRWRLVKRVPVAAGLGGGSSDAAGALRLLQRCQQHPMRRGDLLKLAARIGSDVPFFLAGGLARGRGRGERLERVEWPAFMHIVLVVQHFGLSTRVIFQEIRLGLTPEAPDPSVDSLSELRTLVEGQTKILRNDLSQAVFLQRPELREGMEKLEGLGFSAVGLSGSGPTLYGITPSRATANMAAEELRRRGQEVILTRLRRQIPRVRITESI